MCSPRPAYPLFEHATSGAPGRCGAAQLGALAKKCRADLSAFRGYARKGDAPALQRALARSDAGYEKRFAKAQASGACEAPGDREALRLVVDDGVAALAGLEGLDVGPSHAALLRPGVRFERGEREKRLWLPVPAAGELLFELAPDLHAAVYDRSGAPLGAAGELPSELSPDAAGLRFDAPTDLVNVVLRRSGDLGEARLVPFALAFDDLLEVASDDADFDGMLYSPLRSFPDGAEVSDLPLLELSHYETFADWVEDAFGWNPGEGLPALEWLFFDELFFTGCPAGFPGATPPAGAAHDQNECGISTFIHSMQSTFPGALAPDVTTNPTEWDRAAGFIGHTNTFGTPGTVLIDQVDQLNGVGVDVVTNLKFQEPSRTRDGKFYCADRISDVGVANLAAWNEDCDLKALAYDVYTGGKPFGHWIDVNSVTPDPADATKATLNVQDYAASYDVGYESDGDGANDPTADFGVDPAAAGSVMASDFAGGNRVCGDDSDERLYFYVVCECDRSDPLWPVLPSTTKSGKPLAP